MDEALQRSWRKVSRKPDAPCLLQQADGKWFISQAGEPLNLDLGFRGGDGGQPGSCFVTAIDGSPCFVPMDIFLTWACHRGPDKPDDGSWSRLVKKFPAQENKSAPEAAYGVNVLTKFLVDHGEAVANTDSGIPMIEYAPEEWSKVKDEIVAKQGST